MKKYENFARALNNLKKGIELPEPYSIVEQTGLAGLFSICFEQSWKLMKQILEKQGRTDTRIGSPKTIIKIAYQCGMIRDMEGWLELLEARNILAHTYSDEDSLAVIRKVKETYWELFDSLQKEIEQNWL